MSMRADRNRSEYADYLGSGVYIDIVGGSVVITAENGIIATDVIYLHPDTFAALLSWAARTLDILKGAKSNGQKD
jgi:hypothetical protein